MSQKYHAGDRVMIDTDLGPTMRHFPAGREAVVIGSFEDICRGHSCAPDNKYCLHVKGKGEVSWYSETQMDLIEKVGVDVQAEIAKLEFS